MLSGWVLDLGDGDGGDAIHVEVFSGHFFSSGESIANRGVCFHACSRVVCCIGKYLLVVFMNISYSLSSKKWCE